jgi:hypothetical protein
MTTLIKPKRSIQDRLADVPKKKRFGGKKFKDLTQAEKDQLLKTVAIKLGLIDED